MTKRILISVLLFCSCTTVKFKAPYPAYYVKAKLILLSDSTAYNQYTNECLILKNGVYVNQ